MKKLVVFAAIAFVLSGCAGSKISAVPVGTQYKHTVAALAMAPSGGVLADAVAVNLSNKGMNVIDSAQTSSLMVRLNINEIEINGPQSLDKLKGQGVDAILSVKGVGGYDQQPQAASARVMSTHNGKIIAGATWQNGYGGMAGSIADRTMRKGLMDAAEEISNALYQQLNH